MSQEERAQPLPNEQNISYETTQEERERIIAAINLLKDCSLLVTTIGLGIIAAIGALLGISSQESAKSFSLISRIFAISSVLCFFISAIASVYLVSTLPGIVQRLDVEIQRQRLNTSDKTKGNSVSKNSRLFFQAVLITLLPMLRLSFGNLGTQKQRPIDKTRNYANQPIKQTKTINIWDMKTLSGNDNELRVQFWFDLQLSSFGWGTIKFVVFIILILLLR